MCSIFSIVNRTFGFLRIGLKTEIFGSSSHQGYTLTPQNFRLSVITAAEHHFSQKMFLEGASYIPPVLGQRLLVDFLQLIDRSSAMAGQPQHLQSLPKRVLL